MSGILIIIMIIVGVVFVGSVLLMSPKGGLGMGIGGASGSNEYGSKKSLEGRLKIVAMITGIIFVLIALFLPFVMG